MSGKSGPIPKSLYDGNFWGKVFPESWYPIWSSVLVQFYLFGIPNLRYDIICLLTSSLRPSFWLSTSSKSAATQRKNCDFSCFGLINRGLSGSQSRRKAESRTSKRNLPPQRKASVSPKWKSFAISVHFCFVRVRSVHTYIGSVNSSDHFSILHSPIAQAVGVCM